MKRRASADAENLRRRAAARLKARKAAEAPAPRSAGDERRVHHELQVHQVELELQNEDLLAARLETEASLERYLSLFDFAPLGYAILDTAGIIREVNHAGARIVETPRSAIVGNPFAAFVSPGDRPSLRMLLGRVLEGDATQTCEVELTKGSPHRINARLTATVLARAEKMVLLAFEDITEGKLRERRLAETQSALREADRRKDEFLAVLSHELRNPLGAIRNSIALLSRAERDGDKATRAKTVIDRQVSLLARIVDDLLDVTRIARGKIALQRGHVELAEIVRRALDDHRLNFEAGGIHLESQFEPGPFWIEADAARLVQVIGNLLANAEKFTPRGGTVLVTLRRDDDRKVALRVRDSGAGIDPAMLPHVFESFVQAPQTMDRARGGLGLGLAMVKGIVELHGGFVGVTSGGLGRGTEVTILLPAELPPASVFAEAPEVARGLGRRVLVIDDNADNADSMREALEEDGHDVRGAYDGPTGVELARAFHPEIVICDIGLPGMDGYEVARTFRADPALAHVTLVAVTGYTQPEDLARAREAGFDRHLAKPVQLETLEGVIAEAPPPA